MLVICNYEITRDYSTYDIPSNTDVLNVRLLVMSVNRINEVASRALPTALEHRTNIEFSGLSLFVL
jgi:hypothetical protein